MFRPGMLPTYRQTFYQLLDIDVPEVYELVHANDGQVGPLAFCNNTSLVANYVAYRLQQDWTSVLSICGNDDKVLQMSLLCMQK